MTIQRHLPLRLTLALAALGLMAAVGCNNQPKDEHWTGGSSAGTTKRAVSDHSQRAAPRASRPRARRPAMPMGKRPRVAFRTSQGAFLVELYADKAPITVKNFLRYVDEKFYDGTIFHRVMSNFMIQGGGFTQDLQKKETHGPIKNEADNGLHNTRGTIAMARTPVVDSATAQFFINVKNNPALDHRGPGPRFGYTVFGKVVQGMDVVDKIRNTPVEHKSMMFQHLPTTPVIIKSVRRVK